MTQAAGLKSVAGARSRPAAMGLAIQLGEFLQSMHVDVSDVEHLFFHILMEVIHFSIYEDTLDPGLLNSWAVELGLAFW